MAAITRRIIISPTEDEAEAAAAGVPAAAVAVAGFAAGGDETPHPHSILSSCFRSQMPSIVSLIDSDHEMNIHAFYVRKFYRSVRGRLGLT